MDCGDFVVCLVVLDQADLVSVERQHQGYNLPRCFLKRLTVTGKLEVADKFDLPDLGTSLGIEYHPITEAGVLPT